MAKSNVFWTKIGFVVATCVFGVLFASDALAQRPRFPDFFQAQSQQLLPGQIPSVPAAANPGFVFPNGQPQGFTVAPPPAQIIAPVFDPFQPTTQTLPFSSPQSFNAANTAPALSFPAPQNIQVLPPVQQQTQPFVFQNGQQPFALQPPQFQQPYQQPLFQGGGQFPQSSQTGQFFRRFRDDYLPRLLERPRIRHTFLPGSNGNELQINDTEVATTLTFPRFLFSQQPVRITPGFIAHFWDGPDTLGPFGTGFDLPETAFSAFLTMDHVSDTSKRAGVESNLTVGIYSDYRHLDSDSLRITGVGLGWFRINETNVFKFGAEYFDRIELKLLPAFGLFIRPTNNLELDLYFPKPRIAQRLPNFRALETWMYIAGEYGGGNWTVERIGGLDDRVDINDFRAIVGIEWINQRGTTGFVETGYVFDRELISAAAIPTRRLELEDTVMVRLGLEF